MGKVKQNRHSLKWKFMLYMFVCFIAATIGTYAIGFGTNDLQEWYINKHFNTIISPEPYYEIRYFEDGKETVTYIDSNNNDVTKETQKYRNTYWIISNAQMALIPSWVFLCVLLTGVLFYNRELKKPIDILFDASKKIADNELDFTVEYKKQNELGTLCAAFDDMRSALYKSNREMWRSLEERKRLNAAFSHDLRTPLTVLKGYADFLEKYIPDGRVSEQKLMSVIAMMNGQITRLEHYTQKMNAVQKLEDIQPNASAVSTDKLYSMLAETGGLICGGGFSISPAPESEQLCIDTELVMQVYENLAANAARYAKERVEAELCLLNDMLYISLIDDGGGFSEQALKNAAQPFFRDEKEPDKLHFGLGLYICRIICEKCGGELTLENVDKGAKVTASFNCLEK